MDVCKRFWHATWLVGVVVGGMAPHLAYCTTQAETAINNARAADNVLGQDLATAFAAHNGDSAAATQSLQAERAAAAGAKTPEEKDYHLLAFTIIALHLQTLEAQDTQWLEAADMHKKLGADLSSLSKVQQDIDTGGPLLQMRSDKDKDAVGAALEDIGDEEKNAVGMVDLANVEAGDLKQRDDKIAAVLMGHINKKDSFATQARTLLADNQQVLASLIQYLKTSAQLGDDIKTLDSAVFEVLKNDRAGLHMPMSP